jgi:hypothetical protein
MTETTPKIAAPWTFGVLWEHAADGGIDDANVSASDGTAISIFGPHAKEKAHLIAAAPALYEALEAMLRGFGLSNYSDAELESEAAKGNQAAEFFLRSRDALALARGEG